MKHATIPRVFPWMVVALVMMGAADPNQAKTPDASPAESDLAYARWAVIAPLIFPLKNPDIHDPEVQGFYRMGIALALDGAIRAAKEPSMAVRELDKESRDKLLNGIVADVPSFFPESAFAVAAGQDDARTPVVLTAMACLLILQDDIRHEYGFSEQDLHVGLKNSKVLLTSEGLTVQTAFPHRTVAVNWPAAWKALFTRAIGSPHGTEPRKALDAWIEAKPSIKLTDLSECVLGTSSGAKEHHP
ncbi:MAG: hypothetical protein U0166_01095 [Acidobacteriota bacterium]